MAQLYNMDADFNINNAYIQWDEIANNELI